MYVNNKKTQSLSVIAAAAALTLACTAFSAPANAQASRAAMRMSYPQVLVNHAPVDFEGQPPVERQGRLLVPLRGILEKMGAYVDFDNSSQTVTARSGDTRIMLPIGSDSARVNGRSVPLDVPAQVVNGSTMVPLRFVAESLGANVDFDVNANTVTIDTGSGGGSENYPDRPNRPNRPDPDRTPPVSGQFRGEFLSWENRGPNSYLLKMSNGREIEVSKSVPVYYQNQRINADDLRSGDRLTIAVDPDTHRGTRIIIGPNRGRQ